MRLRHGVVALAGLAVAALSGPPTAFAQFTSDVGATVDINVVLDVDSNSTFDFAKAYTEDITVTAENEVSVKIEKNIKVDKHLRIDGDIAITGAINVNASAMATLDDKQLVDHNLVNTDDINSATMQNNVARDASGNLQFNLSAGHNNAQDNSAAIASLGGGLFSCSVDFGCSGPGADAEIFAIQKAFENFNFTDTTTNDAEILDQVLELATGNIQVNVAAGAGNLQKNDLALASTVVTSVLAEASAAVLQQNALNATSGDYTNTANLEDDVLRAAVGNIQVSLAAGTNNSQHNGLALAATN